MVGFQLDMPPRSSLTSQFSIADSNNEVVCPLRNQDGSSCRKRCIGVSRPPARHPRMVSAALHGLAATELRRTLQLSKADDEPACNMSDPCPTLVKPLL